MMSAPSASNTRFTTDVSRRSCKAMTPISIPMIGSPIAIGGSAADSDPASYADCASVSP
jgi:hypothetical protein